MRILHIAGWVFVPYSGKRADMNVKSKVWLEKEGKAVFGAGKLSLLEAIESEGSISGAARKLNMSFRHAWSSINSAEENLGIKLIVRKKGGTGGGESTLTKEAGILMKKYSILFEEVLDFSKDRFHSIFSGQLR
ncbi:MAG TPA: LysR family transcriptional regulator [Spirochaetes bacterium]|nr:LysR family transcriptional regulator [Spirochaetota bacterium]